MKIKGTSLVQDILKKYPETFDVFLINGFKYKSIEEFIKAIGEKTMLKTILDVREINLDLFVYYLEEKILKVENEKTYLLSEVDNLDNLDFYGNTICPLKFTFKDALEKIVKTNYEKTGEKLRCYIESGKGNKGVCDEVVISDNIDDLPNLIFSKEFNEYLSNDFIENVVDTGEFKGDFYQNINKEILDAGIVDPKGNFGVYGVMADVFLVDLDKLGDLPIPKTLEDLLNPIYKDNIVIFGKQKKEFSNATFLYVNKEYGEEGLKKLSYNVK